jgi:hypothetical protein
MQMKYVTFYKYGKRGEPNEKGNQALPFNSSTENALQLDKKLQDTAGIRSQRRGGFAVTT